MPARLTTASQPRRASALTLRASHPLRRERTRTSRPASRRAAQTCRPRNPVPPTTAICPMPLIYEHVHITARGITIVVRGDSGSPEGAGGGGDSSGYATSSELGFRRDVLQRPPPDAEEDR